MANIRISQLPVAPSAITGTELVPIVQNGQTVQTTVANITNSPVQTQTFLTIGAQASLPNSRYIGGGLGIGTTDGGAQGLYSLFLNGTSASLENASTGIIVKSATNTVVNRSIAVGTAGLSIADGTGVSGNPTLSLTGLALSAATLTGNGIVSLVGGSYFQNVTLTGTANQISVTNGNGGSNPTFSIANNPVIPGSASLSLPAGDTASRPAVPSNGMIRYNTDTALFEGYLNGVWTAFASGSGVTSIATGTGLTGGPITSTGTISIANTAVTAGSYGSATEVGTFTVNAQGQLTAASNVSITAGGIGAVASVSGTANEITATGTTNVTLSLPTALTFTGKTVTGGTLTGVSINGSTNTLSNIGNGSLTNSSVTIGTTSISLGSSSLTLGGLTSVAVTQDPSTALQLATKQYVDTLVSSGITYHTPVKYEVPNTTGNLNATYNQPGGPGVGVGATLTNAGTLAAFAPDGPTALVGDRVLVYNQTNQFENGVYEVSVVGDGSTAWVLTRTTDADTYALKSTTGLGNGDAFFVTSGNTGAGETYVCNTTGVITFGTTAITFAQISASQVYSAGTGLNLSPVTTFNISNTGVTAATYGSSSSVPTIAVNAQGQITSASNTSIAINANQVTSGTLATTVGGTGLSSFTSGGAIYATSTSALTSGTLPITAGGTGITSFGTGVQTALGQNVTGSGGIVLDTSPTLVTPLLGTPSSGTLTNCSGLPLTTGVTGILPIANGGTGTIYGVTGGTF